MAEAWIRGKSAPLDDAIAEAANIVAGSRQPVIAGLGTDVAGARAAIKLARLVGGVVDHMHSGALLRDLDVVREAGMMVTMPTEAHVRADLLLLVGPGLIEAWPALPERLFAKRRVVWLCPDAAAVSASTYENVAVVGNNPADLPAIVALLRARCAGRPVANAPIALATIDALVAELRRARFGVAVWSAARHDSLTIEDQGTHCPYCALQCGINLVPTDDRLTVAARDFPAAKGGGWCSPVPCSRRRQS